MDALYQEVGRTIRYAIASGDRTVRLIAISVVGTLLSALYYLLMHQVG